MHHSLKLSLIACAFLSTATIAEESFRQHEAHVHGHVELNIAQDGNELLVEISAPGSDIVGFEHSPENDAQHELIESAEKKLANAHDILIIPSSAKCNLEHVSVSNSLEAHSDHDEHEKHEKHEKHEEHKHESHEHESHEHESDHDKTSDHGEFAVEYHFECANISQVKEINTKWFELFPHTEEISVNLLTDSAQKALELTEKSHVITF